MIPTVFMKLYLIKYDYMAHSTIEMLEIQDREVYNILQVWPEKMNFRRANTYERS